MEIEIKNSLPGTVAGENRSVEAEQSATKSGKVGKTEAAAILGGENVILSERFRELIRTAPVEDVAALMEMMQKVYESEKERIDCLKPSDKIVELRQRRLEELKELMRKTEDAKIDFEEALKQFTNMLPPDLVAAFDDELIKVALQS